MTTNPGRPRAHLRRGAVGLALGLALAACGTAPPERVHSLLAGAPIAGGPAQGTLPGTTTTTTPTTTPTTARRFVFTVSPVRLPPGVDGPQWLVRLPDDTLARLEQDRWAASLREEFRAALVDQLVRQGGIEARTVPGGVSGPASGPTAVGDPSVRVELDLRRFETAPGRGVWVAGSFTLVPPAVAGAPLSAGLRCAYERDVAEPGAAPALAAAHRRVVEDLAARIAAAAVRMADRASACGA